MENGNHHITSHKFYLLILGALMLLTLVSVGVTRIELGPLATFTALALATVKSVLVLAIFMHLKFDHKIFTIMFAIVTVVFIAIIFFTTTFDYSFRM